MLEEYRRNKIDVMEGIDFKSNQERMKKKEAIRKNYKKQKFYKELVLIPLLIAFIIAVIALIINVNKATKEAVNNCVDEGYSLNYCENKYY